MVKKCGSKSMSSWKRNEFYWRPYCFPFMLLSNSFVGHISANPRLMAILIMGSSLMRDTSHSCHFCAVVGIFCNILFSCAFSTILPDCLFINIFRSDGHVVHFSLLIKCPLTSRRALWVSVVFVQLRQWKFRLSFPVSLAVKSTTSISSRYSELFSYWIRFEQNSTWCKINSN